MKPETKFRTQQVIPFLKTLNKTTFFSISQKSISGTPDILMCINGKFVAMELKSEEGKASPLQERNLNVIRRSGGSAFVVSPKNWEITKYILISYNSEGR